MTPKEKALELYNKYLFIYIPNYTSSTEVKDCAKIAIEEAMDLFSEETATYLFWKEVKNELEKLNLK